MELRQIVLVIVTDFAMNFSAKRDGFCDRFCGRFFVLCFPKEEDGFWNIVSLAKDGQKGKHNLGVKGHDQNPGETSCLEY